MTLNLARCLSVVQTEPSVVVGCLCVSTIQVDAQLKGHGEDRTRDLLVVETVQAATAITI